MAKFLHKFWTQAEFEAAYEGAAYNEPWLSLTRDSDRVDYNKEEEQDNTPTNP